VNRTQTIVGVDYAALTPRQERLREHLLDFARQHGRKPNRKELRAILSKSRRGLL
jgi:ribosomal protein S15P/S13E